MVENSPAVPVQPLGSTAIEERVASLEKGVRLLAITILFLSSIPGVLLAFSIKPYATALRAMSRPPTVSPVYMFVLDYPSYFIVLAILLPLAGIIITARAQNPLRAMLACCVYLFLVLVQFSITWAAFVSSAKAVIAPLGRM